MGGGIDTIRIAAPTARWTCGASAALAAFCRCVALGNRYLRTVSMKGIQTIVAVMLFMVAAGLVSGVL